MRRGIRLKGIKTVTKPNGKRFIYRRVNGALVPLPDFPRDSQEFLAAYVAAGDVKPKRSKAAQGSIAALCEAYLASSAFRDLADSTRRARHHIVDRIKDDVGQGMLVDLRQWHIRKDVQKLTSGASRSRLKTWRALCSFAVNGGDMLSDPSVGVKPTAGKTTPFHQWTSAEVELYRKHWPIGSRQRTAMEVLYWTAARCVDGVRLGNQMLNADGFLHFIQSKTKGPAVVPISTIPIWCDPLREDRRFFLQSIEGSDILWIQTQSGSQRTVKGLSNYIKASALKAGLPSNCSAHGLRKARAAKLAEIGATPHQIGAWTGHNSMGEISHYTAESDRVRTLMGGGEIVDIGNRL